MTKFTKMTKLTKLRRMTKERNPKLKMQRRKRHSPAILSDRKTI